ncbi:MAG: ADP-dependent glucokinase/phosphofructokinase [Candidatus Micrarchaeia archaeon]
MVSSAIFAFNANVDLIKHTDAKGALEIAKKAGIPKLADCVKNGQGAEEIVDRYALQKLMAFGYDEQRAGGQAGNMANAAASMGMRAYMHTSVVSRDIAKHLCAGVMVPSPFCFQKAEEIMSDGEVPIHFVVDFGTDRYIASYDMHNTHMLINRNFKRCAEHEIRVVDRAVIGGFHLLDIPEPRGRVEEVKVMVKRWKASNRRLKVHLELGDFQKPRVLPSVFETLAPHCDSVGMNELEARQAVEVLGKKWKGEAAAMDLLLGVCKSVVLHTARYAAVAGEDADGAEKRLALGHLMASFAAGNGRAPTGGELAKMKAAPVQVKPEERKKFGKGIAFVPALRTGEERTKLGLGDSFSVGYFCSKQE